MKRTIVVLLGLAMLIGVLSFSALAEEIRVVDEQGFMKAMETGGTVVLDADIPLSTYVDIQADITLDLNGHRIYVAEEAYSATILNRVDCNVTVRDSAGGGQIGGGEKWLSLSSETGNLLIEGGALAAVSVTGGNAQIKKGQIGQLQFNSIRSDSTVMVSDDVQVEEWECGKGTVNIDPTSYLKTGYTAMKNPDGTYTVDTVMVEKTGETIKFYYDAYSVKREEYALTRTGEVPTELMVEILVVNDGESENILMTKCDEEGRLWVAEIDKAYFGAEMCVVNERDGVSTVVLDVPTKTGTQFNGDNEWMIREEPQPEKENLWWIWVVIGVAITGAATAAVVVFATKRKKKGF